MNIYPFGNTINVRWHLTYPDGTPFPLSEYSYELSYRNSRGEAVVSDSSAVSVEDNMVVWNFTGNRQEAAGSGVYSLSLKVIRGTTEVLRLCYDSAFALSAAVGAILPDEWLTVEITSICSTDIETASANALLSLQESGEAKSEAEKATAANLSLCEALNSLGLGVFEYDPSTGTWSFAPNDSE